MIPKVGKEPLGLGFVGAGFIGQVAHISNFSLNPQCALVGICEARTRLREKVQAHYGFKRSYSTHADLLSDPEVKAVVAITRRPHTGPLALAVLRSGRHLLTEKPMCHPLQQARILVDEMLAQKVLYSVGFMR